MLQKSRSSDSALSWPRPAPPAEVPPLDRGRMVGYLDKAVAQALYKMAISGTCPAATMFWLKCRAGWKETSVLQHSGPNGGPIQFSNDELDKHITDELARIAATRGVAPISGASNAGTEDKIAAPMEGLARKT